MDSPLTFGKALRMARRAARFSTITAFADALSQKGIVYSDDAIGKWENDQRKPPERDVLLPIFSVLAAHNGFASLSAVNQALWLLGWRNLSVEETVSFFPMLTQAKPIPNLPKQPAYERLVGRDDLVQNLTARLTDSGGLPLVVISGLGGIGKTALAYEVVFQLMTSGAFMHLAWESAQSEEFTGTTIRQRSRQPLNPLSILLSYAQQLDIPLPPNATLEVVRIRLRDTLRRGRYLLVLDNLETLEIAHDLADMLYELVTPSAGIPPSRVLITSRERLADVAFVFDEFLHGLSEPTSHELLRLEAKRREAESLLDAGEALMHRIYTVTGGMPLALQLIVSQYLSGIALDDELDRLSNAADEEELYRFIYFTLWGKLSIPEQKVLIGTAAFRVAAQQAMLIEVSTVSGQEFINAVRELNRMSLIEVQSHPLSEHQRYDVHAMTRWFVNGPLTEQWNRQKLSDSQKAQ